MRQIETIDDHNAELIRDFKLWLDNSKEHRPLTQARYLQCMKTIADHADFPLDEGSDRDLRQLVGDINNYRLWEEDQSPWTRKKYKNALSMFARVIGFRDRLEFMSIGITTREESDIEPETLPKEHHIEDLMPFFCNPRDKAMVLTAWKVAARAGGLLSLRWEDIHYTDHPKTGEDHVVVDIEDKTGHRSIPCFGLIDRMQAWERSHPNPEPDEIVFSKLGKTGTMSNNNALHRLKDAYGRSNQHPEILQQTFRAIRKGRACHFARQGMNAFQLKKFMGWNDISTSVHYIRVANADLKETIYELDQEDQVDLTKHVPRPQRSLAEIDV